VAADIAGRQGRHAWVGGSSAGAAWTPASVSTAFWYDASNLGSITKDGSNNVQQWNDLSGNARHLTQATTTNEPVYTASVLNSLAGIHFINANSITTNSMMATATFTVAQPFTVVVVFKNGAGGPNTTPGGMTSFGLLVDGDINQSIANRMILFAGRNDVSNHATYYAGTGSGVDTTVILSANTAYHLAAIFNGASSSSDINGTTTTGSPGAFGVANGISIGSTVTSQAIDCYLCELFCIPDTTHLANALSYVSFEVGCLRRRSNRERGS
jgi:hypothetical protein